MALTANEMVRVLQTIPGAASVKAEQVGGAPALDVKLDRAAIARLGLTVRDVADTVAAGLGGRASGLVYEGARRFDVTVRVAEATRAHLHDIRSMPLPLPEVEGRASAPGPPAQGAHIPPPAAGN